jgi:predicted metalloprotease
MAGMAAMKNDTTENDTAKSDAAKADDVIARLAGKGEEAIRRLADLPGSQRALEAFNDLKLRVDDLSKKMRGVDELEKRVAKLEKDLAALKRAQKPSSGG